MEVDPHVARPTRVNFSHNSRLLAVPVQGGLNLYEIPSGGQILKRCEGLQSTILGRPQFSDDGQSVALIEISSITLWKTAAGSADDTGQPQWTIPSLGNGEGAFDELGLILAAADCKPLLRMAAATCIAWCDALRSRVPAKADPENFKCACGCRSHRFCSTSPAADHRRCRRLCNAVGSWSSSG